MGYRGKLVERDEARRLRADGMRIADIADTLSVSKSSVSIWVRDVAITPIERRPSIARRPSSLLLAKLESIHEADHLGRALVGELAERDLFVAGIALYAGEGSKTDGQVVFTNSDPRMVSLFCDWLRRFFDIDEHRLRAALYLHEGLDLGVAEKFWSGVTGIALSQFRKPYRAVADASIRSSKHPMGCLRVVYASASIHRNIMGLVGALLSSSSHSGVAQPAEHSAVNRQVVSSSLTPGASREGP